MKAMKLKSCFLLIGLLLVCNVYAQELCRAIDGRLCSLYR